MDKHSSNDSAYKAAVAAACRELGISKELECEWAFVQRNLWRKRDDGLWEWTGRQCPPKPSDNSVHFRRDCARQSWVCVPTGDDQNENVNEI